MRRSFYLFRLRFDYHDGLLTIYRQVPHSDRDSWISKHIKVLEENPDDVLTRFAIANNLRMDGQIQRSRIEYRKVAEANHPDWSYLAKKVLQEFEGVEDHAPQIVWQQYRILHLKFWSNK